MRERVKERERKRGGGVNHTTIVLISAAIISITNISRSRVVANFYMMGIAIISQKFP